MKFKNSYIVILFFVSCVTYSGLFDLARKVPYGDRLPCVKVEDRINFYKELGVEKKQDVTPFMKDTARWLFENSGLVKDSDVYKAVRHDITLLLSSLKEEKDEKKVLDRYLASLVDIKKKFNLK